MPLIRTNVNRCSHDISAQTDVANRIVGAEFTQGRTNLRIFHYRNTVLEQRKQVHIMRCDN